MRSTSAIVFLLIYLSANTEFHQVLKIPALINHYTEHDQNSAIRFIDFIVVHYFREDVKDADYEKDQKLPFKNTHCVQTSISITTPPEKLSAPTMDIVIAGQKKITPYFPFRASSFCFSIWQPPKI